MSSGKYARPMHMERVRPRRQMPIAKMRAKVARLYGYDEVYVGGLSRVACENLIIQARHGGALG